MLLCGLSISLPVFTGVSSKPNFLTFLGVVRYLFTSFKIIGVSFIPAITLLTSLRYRRLLVFNFCSFIRTTTFLLQFLFEYFLAQYHLQHLSGLTIWIRSDCHSSSYSSGGVCSSAFHQP